MSHYPKDGVQSVHHIAGGRRLGNKDYHHSHESSHLDHHEKKESHYKHESLLHKKD